MKKKVGVKKVKKSQNCGRENKKVPVKKIVKIAKNVFHGHFSFSRGKKKTLLDNSNVIGSNQCLCLPVFFFFPVKMKSASETRF